MTAKYYEEDPNPFDKGDFWIISSESGSWNIERILDALHQARPLPAPLGWGVSHGDRGQRAEICVRPHGDAALEKTASTPVLATYRWRMIGRGDELLPYLGFTLQR